MLLKTNSWGFDENFFSSEIKSQMKITIFLANWVEQIARVLFLRLFFLIAFFVVFEFGRNFWEYLS